MYGAKRPRRPLWGVAERSESFKIMIAGGNHTAIKSCCANAKLRGCSWMNGS